MNEYLNKKKSSGDYGRQETLPPSLQNKMNQSFGMDFSSVKLYRNEEMAGTGMQGLASGNRVIISKDVDLNSKLGQAVLGHELSHIRAQSQGIGMGNSGLYNNAALERQADREGMMAANAQPIFGDRAGMGDFGTLKPLSGGLSASAGAPMQAKGDKAKRKELKAAQKAAEKENRIVPISYEQIGNIEDTIGIYSANKPSEDSLLADLENINNSDMEDDEKKAMYGKLLTDGGHAHRVDFFNFDVDVARDFTKKILQNKNEFKMIPKLNFLGSMRKRVRLVTDQIEKYDETVIKNRTTELLTPSLTELKNQYDQKKFTNEQYLKKQEEAQIKAEGIATRESREIQRDIWRRDRETIDDAIGATYNVGEFEPYLPYHVNEFDGIVINDKYGTSYKDFINNSTTGKNATQNGNFYTKGADVPGSSVDHEMGHVMDNFVGGRNDPEIKARWEYFKTKSKWAQARSLSEYGSTTIAEFIAESWCEYRNNPKMRSTARGVVNRILQLYRQKVRELNQAQGGSTSSSDSGLISLGANN